uniref:H/ACA ribonucleoprotein complex subunit n=1 Tax=Sarcophilus harrisii TaxID=9305 RepID=A0A7N4P364_SARHA
ESEWGSSELCAAWETDVSGPCAGATRRCVCVRAAVCVHAPGAGSTRRRWGSVRAPEERRIPDACGGRSGVLGEFLHPCEDDIVCKCITHENKVPYFNAPVYLENKEQIGKVDEIFGQLRDFYFSVKLSENMKASSFKKLQKFYIDPYKLLPLQRFLPRPPGEKAPPRGGGGGGRGGIRGGRGGGRGGRGGGGRGGKFLVIIALIRMGNGKIFRNGGRGGVMYFKIRQIGLKVEIFTFST